MKIVSYNLNGIRSAVSKGLYDWLALEQPDIVCFQEIKASEDVIDLIQFSSLGYYTYIYPALKKGYSGTAVISKIEAIAVEKGTGNELYDNEGRFLKVIFPNFSIYSIYLPSGTTGEIRQEFKMECLAYFKLYIAKVIASGEKFILSGDFNICHEAIDIHDPKGNAKSSGFLPEERAWFSEFLNLGLVDSFRHLNKDPHHYSWWSYRAGARANNKGWRIDYHLLSNNLLPNLRSAYILPSVVHSDHCPIVVEMEV